MSNHFKRRPTGPRLALPEAERQGRIAQLAFSLLGKDEALAFLNEPNDALGGRPIDLAMESETGFSAVEQALRLLQK